jgi:hypothetical protein
VVILPAQGGGQIWGVRVTDTDFPSAYAFGPCRKDDIGELVPFLLSLGSIRVSLAELAGVCRHSVISLGRLWSEESGADLIVAGLPLARGRVVVVDEEMGLRVTQMLGSPCESPIVGSSGYLLDREVGDGFAIEDYDFRRPDRFTREQIKRIHDIHVLALRNLRARLPQLAAQLADESQPSRVDQCTLGEALSSSGLRERVVVVNRSWRPSTGAPAPWGPLPVRLILEEEGSEHPVASQTRARLEQVVREAKMMNRGLLFLAHGQDAAVRDVLADPAGLPTFLACLRDAWRNVVDLNLAVSVAPEGEGSHLADHEMVVLVIFGGRGGRPAMAVIYPYGMLEPFLGVLAP